MNSTPFLTAAWRDLIMLTWSVEQKLLASYLPRGVELDLWKGQALASVVAFRFEKVRVRGFSVPFHTSFPEVNLRFYVRRKMPTGEWRRGVVFVQEMVPRATIAWAARRLYDEPYVSLPMREAHLPGVRGDDGESRRTLLIEWNRDDSWERVVALAIGDPRPMRAGSLEEFVTEHYWGYTARGARATMEYHVQHPRWNISPLAECFLEADIRTLFGQPWVAPLSESPLSAVLADGSDIEVFRGTELPATARQK